MTKRKGQTKEEAKSNFMEVIDIQFEEMTDLDTLNEYIEKCGYRISDDTAISLSEMVGFEKMDMQMQ